MRVTVLQHVPFEDAGAITPWLEARGHNVATCALFDHQALPSLRDLEALVVLGGPMGVHDVEDYPWLVDERDLIRAVMTRDLPLLGICLGAQQMAVSLGAEVRPGANHEIGWWPLHVKSDWLPIPSGSEVFHWHGDRFDLPQGCEPLASTEACPYQGFRRGRALGLQFHLETTPTGVESLLHHGEADLSNLGPWVQSPETMRSDVSGRCHQLHHNLGRVLEAWLNA